MFRGQPILPRMEPSREESSSVWWRRRLYIVIFQNDTRAGRAFNAALLAAIAGSVIVVMLESVAWYRERYGPALVAIEWFFTILFTVEYILRILSVRHPRHYMLSPLGWWISSPSSRRT
jgi:voltage-gated potassium channel